ncbi:glucan-binding YG repeat protein [Elusimicrobium posterum]|uniref:hypothetical protein n=1 Tax=Elusimicrobium posterum TaxID=3116653 RepID=UPI003C793E2B
MIEKWDIKSVDAELHVFIEGTLSDAKIVQKKLHGFSKEPRQTSIPPYTYSLTLTTRDPDTLEKIKIAVAEAVEQSSKAENFIPATLENAGESLKRSTDDDVSFFFNKSDDQKADSSSDIMQFTSFDLSGETGGGSIKESTFYAPFEEPLVQEQQQPEEKMTADEENKAVQKHEETAISLAQNEGELDKTGVLEHVEHVQQVSDEVESVPTAQQPVEQAQQPAVEAPASQPEPENLQQSVEEHENYKVPSFEDILAAKTVLDMYGEGNKPVFEAPQPSQPSSNDVNEPAPQPKPSGQDKFTAALDNMDKTSFNIFEQNIQTQHDLTENKKLQEEAPAAAEEEAIDPFDLLMSPKKAEQPQPEAPAPKQPQPEKIKQEEPVKEAPAQESEQPSAPEKQEEQPVPRRNRRSLKYRKVKLLKLPQNRRFQNLKF